MGQQAAVKSFFVTLRRSYIGVPWFHKEVLRSLGLQRRLQCVEKPNNASIRGNLAKVAHLVRIETDAMFYNRKVAEYDAMRQRPPIVVRHEVPGVAQQASAAVAAGGGGSRGSGGGCGGPAAVEVGS